LFDNRDANFTKALQRFMKFLNLVKTPSKRKCIYCNKPADQGVWEIHSALCHTCQSNISWIRDVKCHICGRFEECLDCIKRKDAYFIINRSAVKYSNEMRNWLARYKYRGDEALLPLFIEMLRFPYEKLLNEVLVTTHKKFDLIAYIPISAERLVERGFNQAKQFAEGLGKIYNIPVHSLLRRSYHTEKQSYKSREQRLEDMKGVFIYNKDESVKQLSQTYKQLNILLIDDVYTTGSTLNHCASVIREHLNAQVYGLTWAR
jgi:competence protein ComFC